MSYFSNHVLPDVATLEPAPVLPTYMLSAANAKGGTKWDTYEFQLLPSGRVCVRLTLHPLTRRGEIRTSERVLSKQEAREVWAAAIKAGWERF
jgi:hypothetical protein